MISQIHGGRFHMSRKHAAYVVLLAGLGDVFGRLVW